MPTSFQLERFFVACRTSGKEPVTINGHSALNAEEIPEQLMDIRPFTTQSDSSEMPKKPKDRLSEGGDFSQLYSGSATSPLEQNNVEASAPGSTLPTGTDESTKRVPGTESETEYLHGMAQTDVPTGFTPKGAETSAELKTDRAATEAIAIPNRNVPDAEAHSDPDAGLLTEAKGDPLRAAWGQAVDVSEANQPRISAAEPARPASSDVKAASIELPLQHPAAANKVMQTVEGGEEVQAVVRRVKLALTQETSVRILSSPLSTLERHLGGHAATLASPTSETRGDWQHHLNKSVRVETPPANIFSGPQAGTPLFAVGATAITKAGAPESDLNLKGLSGFGGPTPDLIAELGPEARAQIASTHPVTTTAPPRTDMSAHVAQQIADAIRRAPDKAIEIALSPVELGRVRMVLTASDACITLTVLADRTETLDLMRRNIDDLEKSFADMGYEDISFSFGRNEQATDQTPQSDNQGTTPLSSDIGDEEPTDIAIQQIRHLSSALDGIDIRL